MFKNTSEFADNKEAETIIGPSVKVEGDFKGDGNVIVEGIVIGSLATKQNLRVLERASITANIEAANAVVGGKIKGNISVKDRLELTATAHVHGDVEAQVLSMAPGAVLNGKCTIRHEHDETKTKKAQDEESAALFKKEEKVAA